jgi:hypothetical protein
VLEFYFFQGLENLLIKKKSLALEAPTLMPKFAENIPEVYNKDTTKFSSPVRII